MGWNIGGIAINKNYENNFQELINELNWNLVKESEIIFEEGLSMWQDLDVCSIYYTERGTLIFLSLDKCMEAFPLKNVDTFTFALSETSMAFTLNYCRNGETIRSIMEAEDMRMEDEGEPLDTEALSDDLTETIWNIVSQVIGKNFHEIDLAEMVAKYRFT